MHLDGDNCTVGKYAHNPMRDVSSLFRYRWNSRDGLPVCAVWYCAQLVRLRACLVALMKVESFIAVYAAMVLILRCTTSFSTIPWISAQPFLSCMPLITIVRRENSGSKYVACISLSC